VTTFEEDLATLEAIDPRSADTADIELGRRLLAQIPHDDTPRRIRVLVKLGSFFLENKKLDPWQSLAEATECYRETVSLAQGVENARWMLIGSSGCTNVLVRRYELGRDPEDLVHADSAFRELIGISDRLGMFEDSLSIRTNYALMLTKAVHGDLYSNLDKAIELLRQVVHSRSQQVRGDSFDPFQYGRALYNLAVALLKQADEAHVETLNINEAIDLLQSALLYRTADRDRPGRISVLRALAQALPNWEGADSLDHAEQLADEARAEADALALTGNIPDAAEWAQAAKEKSALFWDIDRVAINRANLDVAIADHSANISRIPREQLPFLWAEWVGGYALLVGRIGIEDSISEFWQRSRDAFGDALALVKKNQDPRLCLKLNRELGRVCHQCADWEGSLAANREAAEIGISLVDGAGTNVSRGKELEEVTRAIHFAAYAAAQLGKPEEAAELAEMGRARWLDQAIQLAAIRNSSLPPKAKIELDQAQAGVLDLERRELKLLNSGSGGALRRLENFIGIPFGEIVKARQTADPDGSETKRKQELAGIRAQLQEAHLHLTDLLNSISTDESAGGRLTSAQIQKIASDAGFPIVFLLSSVWGSTAIIAAKRIEILPLPGVVRSTVQELLYGDNGYIYLCTGAREGDLEGSLRRIKEIVDPHIIGPLAVWCRENGITTIAVVGLGDVGLLPLQVSTVPAGLDLKLLPSARSLSLSLTERHPERGDVKSLLTVGDPGSDGLPALPFSGIESSLFASLFRSSGARVTDLSRTPTLEVLEQNLSNPTHLHLACHGTFMPFSPLNSVVHLEGDERLEVESLLRPALKLKGVELAVLSACNSATGEPWRTPDEAIGFPAALLAAGARTVVAAQWEVSDAVTLLIMHQFCRAMLAGPSTGAGSLAEAQRWLSTADSAQLVGALDQILEALGQGSPRSRRLLTEFRDEIRNDRAPTPFADLKYWAGFISVGA
jgi:CHAT domain-containing protein/tetratricopeptide (TPR) repeat protein